MSGKIVALCGGVGGAKLAVGLAHTVPPQDLTIVVNTGDDFEHLGLFISPDVDTVMYSLAGLSDPVRGWGLQGETWAFMQGLSRLKGEDWFLLGDTDLATHVLRTARLRTGDTLSSVTAALARTLGVRPSIVPMTDSSVRTVLDTDLGHLTFQDYFVRHRAEPVVNAIVYAGSEAAVPSSAAIAALRDPELEVIVICPSNPWLSVAPILSMPALRHAVQASARPVVSVSPIVAGTAVKGPTAKLMRELGLDVTAKSVADYYGSLVHGHILDHSHAHEMEAIRQNDWRVSVTSTLMTDAQSKCNLAKHVLSFGGSLYRDE